METLSTLLVFVRGIHRWLVDSPHKGQWHEALIFSLICACTNDWSKQSRRRWFKTPSRSLWRHAYVRWVLREYFGVYHWRRSNAIVLGPMKQTWTAWVNKSLLSTAMLWFHKSRTMQNEPVSSAYFMSVSMSWRHLGPANKLICCFSGTNCFVWSKY